MELNDLNWDGIVSPLQEDGEQIFSKALREEQRHALNEPGTNSRSNGITASTVPSFCHSYRHYCLYYDNGYHHGYKFYDGHVLIPFSTSGSSYQTLRVSRPWGGSSQFSQIETYVSFLDSLQKLSHRRIEIRDLPLHISNSLELEKKKQFRHLIYDLSTPLELTGHEWSNVRQKITHFQKAHPKVRVEKLNPENATAVVHFISEWAKNARSMRGFSYTDTTKDRYAARTYSREPREDVWATVYKIEGRVVSFQLLYSIGSDAAAHAIGLAAGWIPGLSEYAQWDTWRRARERGIRWINDGYSWRRSLTDYKEKFNPRGFDLVYTSTIKHPFKANDSVAKSKEKKRKN